MLKSAAWLLVGAALFGPKPEAVAAELFPSRPIRMIVPSGAGGITDILARVIAVRLSENLGHQVVVDNRPGASGVVGSDIVAKAAPDGHTLLMVFPSHPVIDRLHREIVKIVRSPEFNEVLVSEGATAVGNTPVEFDAVIRADVRKWAEVVKQAGIRPE